MERCLEHHDRINLTVSQKSVGWHLHHLALTNAVVIGAMHRSNPEEFALEENPTRENVMGRGTIIRGHVRTPDALNPDDNLDLKKIEQAVSHMNNALATWDTINDNAFFIHPFMGKLNKALTLKFMTIHNSHHLKIIDDILGR